MWQTASCEKYCERLLITNSIVLCTNVRLEQVYEISGFYVFSLRKAASICRVMYKMAGMDGTILYRGNAMYCRQR